MCRIRQIGYPVRKSFEEFVFRYRCLYLGCGSDHRALLNHLATKGLARHGQWQIGHSKVRGERRGGLALPAAVVLWLPLRALAAWLALTELVRVLSCRAFQIFYRNSQQSDFEAAREEALKGVVTRMQRQARKFIIRCRYARWTRIINVIKEAIGARTLERLEVSWRECFWTWSRWQCCGEPCHDVLCWLVWVAYSRLRCKTSLSCQTWGWVVASTLPSSSRRWR